MFEYNIYINEKLYDVVLDYYEALQIIKEIMDKNPENIGYLVEVNIEDTQ